MFINLRAIKKPLFFRPQSKTGILAGILAGALFVPLANAADASLNNSKKCPVGNLNGVPLDVEFGAGTEAITHCVEKRSNAKLVIAVDSAFPTDINGAVQKNKATFLTHIDKMIDNYEIVNGMRIGKDIDISVVMSASGAVLLTKTHKAFGVDATGNANPNPYASLVAKGLAKGMKFYLCQMAARELGIKRDNMLDGVEFVSGGHIAVADFQQRGYAMLKP